MSEKLIKIELTQTQCNQLANALDVACKAGGIRVAQTCAWFVTLMEAELQKEPEPTPVLVELQPIPTAPTPTNP